MNRGCSLPSCLEWRASEDTNHAGGDCPQNDKGSYSLERNMEPSLGEDAMIQVKDGGFDRGNCQWVDAFGYEA